MSQTLIRSTSSAIRSLAAPARLLVLLLLVLSLSRLAIIGWYWERVAVTDDLGFILLQGIRFDLVLMGMLLGPALLAAPFVAGRKWLAPDPAMLPSGSNAICGLDRNGHHPLYRSIRCPAKLYLCGIPEVPALGFGNAVGMDMAC